MYSSFVPGSWQYFQLKFDAVMYIDGVLYKTIEYFLAMSPDEEYIIDEPKPM